MLGLLSIFSSGGIVVWSKNQGKVPDSVVNALVSHIFIENVTLRSTSFTKDGFTVKYTVANQLGLTFAAVYQTVLQLPYVDSLLEDSRKIFVSLFEDEAKTNIQEGRFVGDGLDLSRFEALISVRLAEVDKAGDKSSGDKSSGDKSSGDKSLGENLSEKSTLETASAESVPRPAPHEVAAASLASSTASLIDSEDSRPSSPASVESPRRRRGGRKKVETKPVATAVKKKGRRRWDDDGFANEDDDEDVVLDYSTGKPGEEAKFNGDIDGATTDVANYGSRTTGGEFLFNELSSELHNILNEGSEEPDTTGTVAATSTGFLRGLIGGKTLTDADVDKAIANMENSLMKKNVAKDVADQLCDIVRKSIVGSKTQSWTSVDATVRAAMTDRLRRILTPNASLDLLHQVKASRAAGSGRPYVISVVGVNGVGKSTNLSKIAFWLLQNNYKVLIAACDTFRSGAVEQLKVHVKRLQELTSRLGAGTDQVQIFDDGYGKDSAVIAQRAVEFGQRNDFDVVLIDTAGRRHNDDRLMSSLEKFAKLANPDKIIMVGEALVGTDSVEQARNFNRALGVNRNIDFFLLSKCDTVGDMIGAIVNMTYTTSIPVLFVGVGQNYTDLRRLSVDWAVNLLMS